MEVGEHVEVGAHVKLWGEHQGDRVPCTDEACSLEHYEREAGVAPHFYEGNVERPSGPPERVWTENGEEPGYWQEVAAPTVPVFRYHRVSERTAIDAVVVGVEPAPKGTALLWVDVPGLLPEEAAAYAESHNVPLRRRTSDGVYEAGTGIEVELPWAKPKLLVLTPGNHEPWSVEYDDVEVVA